MGRRGAAAATAAACWGGSVAITVAGFFGDGLDEPSSVQWSRVNALLLIVAAVLSISWVIDRWMVSPRSAYRLGVEAGERRERMRQQPAAVIPLREQASNGHRAAPPVAR